MKWVYFNSAQKVCDFINTNRPFSYQITATDGLFFIFYEEASKE